LIKKNLISSSLIYLLYHVNKITKSALKRILTYHQ